MGMTSRLFYFFAFIHEHVLFHPRYCKEIKKWFNHPFSRIVFGYAAEAGPVVYFDLADCKSVHLKQRRQKPVHAVVHLQPFQRFTAEYLQRASRVAYRFAADLVPDVICES